MSHNFNSQTVFRLQTVSQKVRLQWSDPIRLAFQSESHQMSPLSDSLLYTVNVSQLFINNVYRFEFFEHERAI